MLLTLAVICYDNSWGFSVTDKIIFFNLMRFHLNLYFWVWIYDLEFFIVFEIGWKMDQNVSNSTFSGLKASSSSCQVEF